LKKEIEKIIEEKAKKIIEKYHFNTFDRLSKKKVDYFTKVKNILYKTLITPERKKILFNTYGFPFNFLFKSDSTIYFSPDFEEALKFLWPWFTLQFFEDLSPEEINFYCSEEQNIKLSTTGIYTYHTIKELSNLFKEFAVFMENNNNFLLETGWPKYTFKKSLFLLLKLSPTCPIKIPKIVEDINEWECNDSLPFIWSKEINLNDRKELIECDYQQAPLLNTLSLKEIGFLEEIRPKIINLKKIILEEINNNLFLNTTDMDSWYKNCVKIIFDNISKDDLDKLLNISNKYNKISIYGYRMNDEINRIICIINWVYQEIKFRKMSSTKNICRQLLKGSIYDEQKDINSIYQWFQFAQDDYEYDRVEKMMTELEKYQIKVDKKIKLNEKFISDVLDSYKKEYLKLPLLIKPKYYEQVKNFIKLIEISKKLTMDIKLSKELDKPLLKRITPLELPPGTKWEDILIQFIDNEKIKITASKNFKHIADYREMGFEDKRKLFPNTQWKFLQLLSLKKGYLFWEDLPEACNVIKEKDKQKLIKHTEKKKQLTKELLMDYFQINEDPFIYQRKKGYQTKFSLLPQEHLQ